VGAGARNGGCGGDEYNIRDEAANPEGLCACRQTMENNCANLQREREGEYG
jgi:hypothetical protein